VLKSKSKCNHLMANISWGLDYRELRQQSLINSLFRLAKLAYREQQALGSGGWLSIPTPMSFLDKRTSWGSGCIKYKYCPDCGTKNKSLKPIKDKLAEKWTIERIIEDM